MSVPGFDIEAAQRIAEDLFGVRASARQLPSERDQNFLLTSASAEKFVLKITNAREERAFLEAQNSVLKHLATRVSFCQHLVPAASGEDVTTVHAANGSIHFVRLVCYLPGVPLAEIKPHSHELLRDLGSKLGQLGRALADFDHPAVHRDFHWDLANGNRIVEQFSGLINDSSLRDLVLRCRINFDTGLRRSVIHGDANDYNVLVDPERMQVTGLIDFGDMVYSYSAGELAIAIAYVVLDKADPRTASRHVVDGYISEFPLLDGELKTLWKMVRLRLAMSVCLAAYQLQQRPENQYLRISQQAIAETLPRIGANDTD